MQSYLNLAKLLNSHIRHSSSQDLSVSQGAPGLGILFSRPTPPVKKNMNSSPSISPFALSILEHKMKEKSSLSFSNKERQTLQ